MDENVKPNTKIKIPMKSINTEPKYDASLISTSDSFDSKKYKKLGLVIGSATQGISLSKTFFSGLKAIIGSRVTLVEESFVKVLNFAIEHMIENSNTAFPEWKKIIGMNFSMSSLNPESVSIIVTGTAIGLKAKSGGKSKRKNKKNRKTRKFYAYK
jgi:uncharacterized protein YbjQ (UPF0145 family)